MWYCYISMYLGPLLCQKDEAPPAPGVDDNVQVMVVSVCKSHSCVGRATSRSTWTEPSGLTVPSTIVTTPSTFPSKAPGGKKLSFFFLPKIVIYFFFSQLKWYTWSKKEVRELEELDVEVALNFSPNVQRNAQCLWLYTNQQYDRLVQFIIPWSSELKHNDGFISHSPLTRIASPVTPHILVSTTTWTSSPPTSFSTTSSYVLNSTDSTVTKKKKRTMMKKEIYRMTITKSGPEAGLIIDCWFSTFVHLHTSCDGNDAH